MKLNNNLKIIIAAVLLTAAVYALFQTGQVKYDGYLGVVALIGGVIALYMGYRFLMAYFGRNKLDVEPTKYAELRSYEADTASGTIKLFFELPEDGRVEFNITDLNGEKLKTIIDEDMNAGNYPIDFDTTKLANGTYFYELRTHNYNNAKKLIVHNA